jgi:caffeoyl-CoA O-methyltransferase
MGMLATSIGATRAVEVGVFTGYSSICVAQQLPPGGTLVACDVSEEWTQIARRYWREAGVADRIDLRIGPAADTLAALIEAGQGGSFDFAFIDADKDAYPGYYEQCLTLLRSGGLVAIDNIFMGGKAVAPPADALGPRAVHRRARGSQAIARPGREPAQAGARVMGRRRWGARAAPQDGLNPGGRRARLRRPAARRASSRG